MISKFRTKLYPATGRSEVIARVGQVDLRHVIREGKTNVWVTHELVDFRTLSECANQIAIRIFNEHCV